MTLRARLGLIALAGLLTGAGAAVLIGSSNHVTDKPAQVAIIVVVGFSFIGTGLYAWDRRPANRFGALMAFVGLAWLLTALQTADSGWATAIATVIGSIYVGAIVHMLLAFPDGRLASVTARPLIVTGYVASVVLPVLATVFDSSCDCGAGGPRNVLLITDNDTLDTISGATADVLGALLMVGAIVVLRRQWKGADAVRRRAGAPVLWTGGLVVVGFIALFFAEIAGVDGSGKNWVSIPVIATFVALPYAFLLGLLRSSYASLADDNQRLTDELRARVAELEHSRATLVSASMAERRRLERDLHDGAQQRLVALSLQVNLARTRALSDPASTAAILDDAREELRLALEELRELARGIHPAVLTDRGLQAAIAALAERSPVPVEIAAPPPGRLPGAVEAAAYFVVAESLTNVAKYASATHATVAVTRVNGHAVVEVADDGRGGADPAAGSGLRGLAERLSALDGNLVVTSPRGGGTIVHAEIPCASS